VSTAAFGEPVRRSVPTSRAALLCAALVLAASPLAAQAVHGRLLDEETGAPIGDGIVTLLMERAERVVARAMTDEDGRFELAAPRAGAYRLRAQRVGYVAATSSPISITAGQILEVEFRLSVQPLRLPPLTVVADRTGRDARLAGRGYYDRKNLYGKYGFAHFLEREDIDRHPSSVSSLLNTLPGVQIAYTGGRNMEVRGRRSRCMRLYIDGAPFGRIAGDNMMTLDAIPLSTIVAIEVYPGMVAPLEFASLGRSCGGIIAVWTGVRR
jgi:5-hydroxyisourate hydrolase-like protein (transthyretin family)